MTEKIMTLAEVDEALCRIAGRAVEIASKGGDMDEIVAELDKLDAVLGPDPRRAREGR